MPESIVEDRRERRKVSGARCGAVQVRRTREAERIWVIARGPSGTAAPHDAKQQTAVAFSEKEKTKIAKAHTSLTLANSVARVCKCGHVFPIDFPAWHLGFDACQEICEVQLSTSIDTSFILKCKVSKSS
jgi:hypothetical protein